jgi:Zn-dependent M28 family amino/carboxypeptidase
VGGELHARIPGRASTGHVVLAAHYDSVAHAPGAADDAAGVAAILETARALRATSPLRNDIDVVITDGEEPGLLGAQAFVTSGVIDPSRSIVVNLEAGGSSGPSMLFQSSPGNKGLIEAFAQVGDPVGGSELAALFELLPNDTDFTVFRDGGFAGLNLIFGDGHVQYHSPTDTPANLDRSPAAGATSPRSTRPPCTAAPRPYSYSSTGALTYTTAPSTRTAPPRWTAPSGAYETTTPRTAPAPYRRCSPPVPQPGTNHPLATRPSTRC